jgi:phage terminase large subunit
MLMQGKNRKGKGNMAYIATTATNKLLTLTKRIRGIAGGTSAGKTISILQILIDKAQTNPNLLISVVSESYPHLRRGANEGLFSYNGADGLL